MRQGIWKGLCAALGVLTTATALASDSEFSGILDKPESVITYDRQRILQSGWSTVAEVLGQLTQAGSTETRADTAFDQTGATHFNLRHLGEDRVLILLNGHRLNPDLNGAVDLSVIPLAIVDRFELWTEGASAAFGPGALSGAVNIITRSGFDGTEVLAQLGQFEQGDGEISGLDFSFGSNAPDGTYFLAASYQRTQPVMAGDRSISAVSEFDTDTPGSWITPQGVFQDFNLGSAALTTDPGTDVTGPGGLGAMAFRPVDFDQPEDRYNFAPPYSLLAEVERFSGFAQGRWRLNQTVQLKAEAFFSQYHFQNQASPDVLDLFGRNIDIAADNLYNVFGRDFAGHDYVLLRRMEEAGPRIANQDTDSMRITFGLHGTIDHLEHPLNWSLDVIRSETNRSSRTTRLDYNRVGQALSGQACRDDVFGDHCVELNVFGGQGADGRGTISSEMLDYIQYTSRQRVETDLDSIDLRIGGQLVDLSTGPISGQLGFEYRRETGLGVSDSLTDSLAPVSVTRNGTAGRHSSNEFFASLAVPLMARAQGTGLNLDLQARRIDSSLSADGTAALARLHWSPRNHLELWASWSRDLNSPNHTQMFGPELLTSPTGPLDPCNAIDTDGDGSPDTNPNLPGCMRPNLYVQNDPTRAIEGSNPHLRPETSQQFSIGMNLRAPIPTRPEIQIRYYRLKLEDRITVLSGQAILNACAYLLRHCDRVRRDLSNPGWDARLINDGGLNTTNIDLGLTFSGEFAGGTHWSIEGAATYLGDYDQVDSVYQTEYRSETLETLQLTSPLLGSAGAVLFPTRDAQVYPRWRSTLEFSVRKHRWAARWGSQCTHSSIERCQQRNAFELCDIDFNGDGLQDEGRSIGSTTYHDIQFSYRIPAPKLELALGIQNLFDKSPPLSNRSLHNYYVDDYRVPGRMPYLRMTVDF